MAQGKASLGVEEEGADFWGDIADPGRREYLKAMKVGRAYFQSATSTKSNLSRALLEQLLREGTDTNPRQLRLAAMKSALVSFQAAVAASPSRADGHLWLGRAQHILSSMEPGSDKDGRAHDPALLRAAAASFTRAQELNPELAGSFVVASALGDILFSQGKLERAVMAYDRAERSLTTSGRRDYGKRQKRARVLSHAAECLMGLGRLEESIQRYKEALTMGYDTVLNHWGLAVAYDRDEQQDKALAHARRAMTRDRKMRILTRPTVFFVPEGEVHYYFAVGHLAQGNLAQARRSFEAYLAKQPESQWAPRARAHLGMLGQGGAAKVATPGKKGLAPKPGQTGAGLEERDRSRYRMRLRSRATYLRRCYVAQLKKKSTLSGRVKVAFKVGKKGKALGLRVKHSTIRSAGLRRCIFKEIRAIYFRRPSSGKVVEMDYTFEFRPLR